MGDITNGIISGLLVVALSKSVDKASKSDFLKKAPSIAKDYFALWQKNNAKTNGVRVQRILEERGYSDETPFRVPSTKFAFGFVQGASVEDEPELQELWAKLLANAVDPNFENDIRISFMSIIKDLTPLDVKVLDIMNNDFSKRSKGTNNFNIYFSIKQLSTFLSVSDFTLRASIDNLKRCQLVENTPLNVVKLSPPVEVVTSRRSQPQRINNQHITPPNPDYFVISALGYLFIDACIA